MAFKKSSESSGSHIFLMQFMKALLHGLPIVDHGSGQISDVVNILFLMYTFFIP